MMKQLGKFEHWIFDDIKEFLDVIMVLRLC